MIEEYQGYFDRVVDEVLKVGFKLTQNEDYSALFERKDGWKLLLEGERHYRPLIDIEIIHPKGGDGLSLRILMNTYQIIEGTDLPPPSLENQLSFLTDNFDSWLINVKKYELTYIELNEQQ